MAKKIWAPEDGDAVIREGIAGTVVDIEDAVAVDPEGSWQVSVRWTEEEEDEYDVQVVYDEQYKTWRVE